MHQSEEHQSIVKLSICITTFNRSGFIGETLESILHQTTNECEVVVLDGGSTDSTEQLMQDFVRRFNNLRYFRHSVNCGFDRDCDRVVELARGEYCWLMTDDDLMKRGAVKAVLDAIRHDVSLIVVNAESRDLSMSRVLRPRWLDLDSDRRYGSGDMDRLFIELAEILTYVGAFIIKRSIWLAREKCQYYGSWFIYIGVIFQRPLPGVTLVMAEPQIIYRMGNGHSFAPQLTQIIFSKWPSVTRSLALSEITLKAVHSVAPWRHPARLFLLRGFGLYSRAEYRQWVRPYVRTFYGKFGPAIVALIPGLLVNTLLLLHCSIRPHQRSRLLALRESRYHFRNYFSSRRGQAN